MQLDPRTLFTVLVTLYACLGFVCLFLPYRMQGSHAVSYWGWGMLALALGSAGIALRGVVPDLVSIVAANALILGALLFIQASASQGRALASYAFAWAVLGVSTLLIAYFTYVQPDTSARIVVSSFAMALLIVRPVLTLIAAVAGASRRARLFTAACLSVAGLLMLGRGMSALRSGAITDLHAPNAVQFAVILLFGVCAVLATLGVVWMEIEQLQADLARLAMIDPLTGILNRRAFMLEYERELSRCARERTGLALTIFDLDRFKDVNDTYGHLVGDKVLRGVAERLRASLRGHDVLGRYGGEEFALLMPGADTAAALAGTERVRLAVGAQAIQAGALSIPITVSAGVAIYGVNGSDWESLLRSADAALYEAKRGGRNRVSAAQAMPAEAGGGAPA